MNFPTPRQNILAFRLRDPLSLTTTGIDSVDRIKNPVHTGFF